jgi:hypothetical protein
LALFAQNNLITQVNLVAGTSVDFVIVSGNSEAQNLAGQIAFAFQVDKIEFHMLYPIGGSFQGVEIEYEPTDQNAEKIAKAIHDALQQSQISNELVANLPPMDKQIGAYSSDGKGGKGKVRIFVGNKP